MSHLHRAALLIAVTVSACDGAPAPKSLAPPDQTTIESIALRVKDNAAAPRGFDARQLASALVADNPAQAFTASFGAGVDVATREGARVGLVTRALGRQDALRPLSPAGAKLAGRRIELGRDDDAVTEWWTNGPAGLEHAFRIARRPTGQGELAIVVGVRDASALPDDAPGGTDVRLRLGDGTELRYGGLLVTDAAGTALPAALEAAGDSVRIRIDDGAARYPIEIDPFLWLAKTTLTRTDGEMSPALRQPTALAAATDTIVVGFPGARVEVFKRSGGVAALLFGGSWSAAQVLGPAPGAEAQAFGRGLAMQGTTLIVGAGLETPNPAGDFPFGYADVFERNPAGTWVFQTHLEPAPEAAFNCGESSFGVDVALDGDTAVISANRMGPTSCGEGRVFVFERTAAVWSQVQVIAPPGTHPAAPPGNYMINFDTNYGQAIALVGNTLVVGQPGRGLNPPLAGAAYVYTRPAPGMPFALQQALLSPAITPGVNYNTADSFGSDVELSRDGVGDVLVVRSSTAVHAFQRAGSVWTWLWQDASATIGFGRRNTTHHDGTRLFVGASADDVGATTDAGKIRIYVENAAGFSLEQTLSPIAPAASGGLGRQVAKSGATLAAGHATGVDVWHRALWLILVAPLLPLLGG